MNLLFLLERILNTEEARIGCEDVGLDSIRGVYNETPNNAIFYFLWIPVAIAIGNIDYLLTRIWKNGLPSYKLQNGISPLVVALWVGFTFLSMLSLLQFGRAPISFVFKFIHVFLELLNLFFFFMIWFWSGHATAILSLAFLGLASSLSMPCENTYPLTSIGAILDSVNFFVVLYQTFKIPTAVLVLVTISFFFHATYIWAFLLMSYTTTDTYAIMYLRLYGVVANCISIHFGVSTIDATYRENVSIYKWFFEPVITRKKNEKNKKDSELMHNIITDRYTLSCEGTIYPSQSWVSYALMCSSLFSSGICYVQREENNSSLYALYGSIGKFKLSDWSCDSVFYITKWNERLFKMASWIIFIMFTMLLLEVQPRIWVAFSIGWLLPVAISGIFLNIALIKRDIFI